MSGDRRRRDAQVGSQRRPQVARQVAHRREIGGAALPDPLEDLPGAEAGQAAVGDERLEELPRGSARRGRFGRRAALEVAPISRAICDLRGGSVSIRGSAPTSSSTPLHGRATHDMIGRNPFTVNKLEGYSHKALKLASEVRSDASTGEAFPGIVSAPAIHRDVLPTDSPVAERMPHVRSVSIGVWLTRE